MLTLPIRLFFRLTVLTWIIVSRRLEESAISRIFALICLAIIGWSMISNRSSPTPTDRTTHQESVVANWSIVDSLVARLQHVEDTVTDVASSAKLLMKEMAESPSALLKQFENRLGQTADTVATVIAIVEVCTYFFVFSLNFQSK